MTQANTAAAAPLWNPYTTTIEDDMARTLSQHLLCLSLSGTTPPPRDEDIPKIIQFLNDNPQVIGLNAVLHQFTDAGARQWAQFIETNKTLLHLGIHGAHKASFTTAIPTILEALTINRTLARIGFEPYNEANYPLPPTFAQRVSPALASFGEAKDCHRDIERIQDAAQRKMLSLINRMSSLLPPHLSQSECAEIRDRVPGIILMADWQGIPPADTLRMLEYAKEQAAILGVEISIPSYLHTLQAGFSMSNMFSGTNPQPGAQAKALRDGTYWDGRSPIPVGPNTQRWAENRGQPPSQRGAA